MSKMGSHNPFGHLKHKLWPKEGLGVKLPIWLPTTKSQESPQFLCVEVACNILLKNAQQGLQLCFRPHLHRRFAYKVMSPQDCRSPFWDSHLGIPRQNVIWMWALWKSTKYTTKGKVVASPKSGQCRNAYQHFKNLVKWCPCW
jgi:hypothetical protein